MAICTDCLPVGWEGVGQTCDSIPLLTDAIENICEAVCDMQCEISRIAVTSDCTLAPEDFFPTLYPACLELPEGAIVLQICSCAQGGVKIWVYDEDDLTWKRFAKEFALGAAGNFANPNTPTTAELNALFDDALANEALVIIKPTGALYYTDNCGVSWTFYTGITNPIDSDVQQTGTVLYAQNGETAGFIKMYDVVIYTNGESSTMPIAVGDLIDITVDFGYTITQFAEATNPVDNAQFKVEFSGPFSTSNTNFGTPQTSIAIRNGYSHTFHIKKKATASGNLRCRIYANFDGTDVAPGDDEWHWQFYVRRTSVSVQRS